MSGKRTVGVLGKAGKLKVVLLIRGCVSMSRKAPTIRPQPCLKREAEGSAAANGDACMLGNVVAALVSFFLVYEEIGAQNRNMTLKLNSD